MAFEAPPGRFVPPFPDPSPKRSSLLRRFIRGWHSWIHVHFAKSYTMKMGEVTMPGLHMYIPNELPLVKEVMDDYRRYPKHRTIVRLLRPAIGNSLFSANGDDWAEQRAMVGPVFRHAALPATLPLMRDATDALLARLATRDTVRPIDIDPLMTHVAADVIFRTLFSVPLDDDGARTIHRGFVKFQRYGQSASMLRQYRLPQLGYWRRADRAAAEIHSAFAGIVRDRYDRYHLNGERPHDDILQGLLEAKHAETGAAFTYRQVIDQVSTIFLAGHETSASAMCWALYMLAVDRDLQDRLRAEIAQHAGDRPIDAEAIRGMTLLRNVFRETLRLYPPVAYFPREVTCPERMRDKDLKPGAMIVPSPWLIHRNAEHWRCPHAFDPDRFDDPANKAAVRDAWMPFGQGPRTCIGAGFATQEAAVVLASVVRAYDLSPVPGDTPEPVARLTLRPRDGLRLMLGRRD